MWNRAIKKGEKRGEREVLRGDQLIRWTYRRGNGDDVIYIETLMWHKIFKGPTKEEGLDYAAQKRPCW